MGHSQGILVTDTSIWIDLHAGGLLNDAFGLPFDFVAPDVIVAELRTPNGQKLVEMGLRRLELSGAGVSKVLELASKYRGPSRADLFALALAIMLPGVLLTGDKCLREAAEHEGVPVHGTLWLLDQLVDRCLLTPATARDALLRMLAKGSRLPPSECKARLSLWQCLDPS